MRKAAVILITPVVVVAHMVPAVNGQTSTAEPPRPAVADKGESWRSMQTLLLRYIETAYSITATMSNSQAHQANLLLLAAGTVAANANQAKFNTEKQCKVVEPSQSIEAARDLAARLADPSSHFSVSYDHYAVVQQLLDLALQKFRRLG